MKHGKKPTNKQRELFYKYRVNPEEWLVMKNLPECLVIVNRHTRQTRELLKGTVKNED